MLKRASKHGWRGARAGSAEPAASGRAISPYFYPKTPERVLFDDLGHQVQTVLDGRRATLEILAPDLFRHDIVAQTQLNFGDLVDWMGQRFDARGIDGLHFFDQGENIIELSQGLLRLAFSQFKSRQMGDAGYVIQI